MIRRMTHLLCIGLAASSVTGCVDNDYDLSEDIDLTIQLGGANLTLPGSSTDMLYLSTILDLEQSSSIKAVESDGMYGLSKGDYVLVQEGNSSPSHFDVPQVAIGKINGSTTTTTLSEFYNALGDATVTRQTEDVRNTIHLEDNDVTRELVAVESADIDVEMVFEVGYSSNDFYGTAYIEPGYTAVFDKCWTVEIGDDASARYLETVGSNVIRFKERYAIRPDHKLSARLRLTKIDLSDAPSGQGLYAPGKFMVENDVVSSGDVSIDLADLPTGERANLTIVSKTSVSTARIDKVRGIVDPKIEIAATDFDINDVPDFLSDPENHLDINNPQITVTVSNSSPLSISLNGKLSSYNEGTVKATVGVGDAYGTAPIIVRGNSTTKFTISRVAIEGTANNIVVPDMGALIETVPDRISFHDATSKALPEIADYTLGSTYTYDCDYEAVVPLAFGDAMRLHYSHTDNGWDEDLDKYNFNTAVVTADVKNTIPLDMIPSAIAVDSEGNEMTNITVSVDGRVEAGSTETPSSSQLTITLRSTGQNIGGLDGVKLIFDATANSGFTGINLNSQQALKFDNIKITLKGGILVDLNN